MTNPFVGVRVKLSPALDLWMRGAFGKIQSVIDAKTVRVRMDNPKIRRLQTIIVDHLSSYLVRNLDVYTSGKTPVLIMTIPSGSRVYFKTFLIGKGSTPRLEASADLGTLDTFWLESISLEKEAP